MTLIIKLRVSLFLNVSVSSWALIIWVDLTSQKKVCFSSEKDYTYYTYNGTTDFDLPSYTSPDLPISSLYFIIWFCAST